MALHDELAEIKADNSNVATPSDEFLAWCYICHGSYNYSFNRLRNPETQDDEDDETDIDDE